MMTVAWIGHISLQMEIHPLHPHIPYDLSMVICMAMLVVAGACATIYGDALLPLDIASKSRFLGTLQE